MDLVRDRGRQTSGDRELFVRDQRVLGLALHRNVAKHQNDADDLSVFVAYRRAAVGDIQFRSVFADQDCVVCHADHAVQPLDLGDRGLHRLAARLVDDVEDLFERLFVSLRLTPAGQLLRHRIHQLNMTGGVAGDYAVANGLERGAQPLFGLKDLLGPASQYLKRRPVSGRDRVQPIAGEQSNQNPHAQGQKQQRQQHHMDLLVPLCYAPRAVVLGLLDDVVEVAADPIHQNLAVQVQGDIVGLAASADLGNDRNSEAIVPGLVLGVQITEIVLHVCVASRHSVKLLNLLLYMRLSFRKGLQKPRVAGRLVAEEAGLLIHNQLRHQGRLRAARVRIPSQIAGRVGAPDLQVECPRDH